MGTLYPKKTSENSPRGFHDLLSNLISVLEIRSVQAVLEQGQQLALGVSYGDLILVPDSPK